MFAGHIGVALAAGRAEPRVNVGLFALAALWLDVVLWTLVLLGRESVTIPADFARTHQPQFVFPFSHGLLAAAAWSALAGALVLLLSSLGARDRRRAAALVAAVVFSHWPLDALVHRAELPLLGESSPGVGAGLWNAMPFALAVETAIVVAGMVLYFPARGVSRGRQIALAALCVLILALTVMGMTVAPAPPSATAMAASSLATIVAVCAVIGWLAHADRPKRVD